MPPAEELDFENMSESDLAALRGDEHDAESGEAGATQAGEEPTADGDGSAGSEVPEGDAVSEPVAEDAAAGDEPAEGQEAPGSQPAAEDVEPKVFMMPKSRYDHAMARAKAAEAKIREMEDAMRAQQPAAQSQQVSATQTLTDEIAELDNKLAVAISEGKTEEIVSLSRQVRAKESDLWRAELTHASEATRRATEEAMEYKAVLARVEERVPQLNQDAEEFDENLMREVVELAYGLQQTGSSAADALTRAMTYVNPPGWSPKAEAQVKEAVKSEASAPASRKTDVVRNAKAQQGQAPVMTRGQDSDTAGIQTKLDPMRMTDADFEKLTEEQLAKMRGDF